MNTVKLTNNAKLQTQIDEWLKKPSNELGTDSVMAKETLVEYMRLYEEHLYCDGDVLMEFYRQCPKPEKFWLEITVNDHVFSAEPSAKYDNALATFKDALAHVKSLGWKVEPTLKWAKADNDTSCANGKDVVEEMFPVIAGWETENPKTGRMLPSRVVFSRECFATLKREIQSAEYGLEVHHTQEIEEPLREELTVLREENRKLKKELEVLRESFSFLVDLASDPHLPTDAEEAAAVNLARNTLYGEELDLECFKDLAREKGLDLSTLIVEGIKRG